MASTGMTLIAPISVGTTDHLIQVNPLTGTYYIFGFAGNDAIYAGIGNDVIIGGYGKDIIRGEGGNDLIYGENTSDTTDGLIDGGGFGLEQDSILGGAGIDVIYAQSGWDYVNGEAGNDLIYGGFGSDYLQGGTGSDRIYGGDGNDVLQGDFSATVSAGYAFTNSLDVNGVTDTAIAAFRSTTLGSSAVDNSADYLDGGAGNDFIAGGGGIDTLLGGAGDDVLLGGTEADKLVGADGNDRLDGGAGADRLEGLLGDDIYDLGAESDVIYDSGGFDTFTSTISRSLVDFTQIEYLVLFGTASIFGTGNATFNRITGNAGANVITGLRSGDRLTGGGGNDRFVYTSLLDSLSSTNHDTITDFDQFGDDRIDLSQVDPGVLVFRGTAAFTGGGAREVRINDVAGPDVMVEINIGTLPPESQIRLTNVTAASMTASDFIL